MNHMWIKIKTVEKIVETPKETTISLKKSLNALGFDFFEKSFESQKIVKTEEESPIGYKLTTIQNINNIQ